MSDDVESPEASPESALETHRDPPRPVLVLSLGFGLLGTVLVFLSGLGLATFYGLAPALSSPAEVEGWRALLVEAVRRADSLLIALGLIGVGLLFATLNFYRLRAWARVALEGVVWSGIGLTFGGGILWYRLVNRLGSVLRTGGRSLSGWGITYLMTVGLAAASAVLLGLLTGLFYLRSRPVRAAMTGPYSSEGDTEDTGDRERP